MSRLYHATALAAFGLLALVPLPASAAEAPRPVVNITAVPTDPARLAWVTEDGRNALTSAMQRQKDGVIYGYVFSAAPGGNFWNATYFSSATSYVSIEDATRLSLERCEYYANAPCYVVSINGMDVRDAAGGLQIQPYLLASQPTEFDPLRVPFLSATDWGFFRGYKVMTTPKALVLTVVGGAWSYTGDNVSKAITAAFDACRMANADNVCILYAVNNRVVFTAGGPY